MTTKKSKNTERPHTTQKRYRAPQEVIEAIKGLAPDYGSQGRALQVATELLIRRANRLRVPEELGGIANEAATYKLVPRTIRLIDELLPHYGGRYGQVLAACVRILQLDDAKFATAKAK